MIRKIWLKIKETVDVITWSVMKYYWRYTATKNVKPTKEKVSGSGSGSGTGSSSKDDLRWN
jgi:hypothetical protein